MQKILQIGYYTYNNVTSNWQISLLACRCDFKSSMIFDYSLVLVRSLCIVCYEIRSEFSRLTVCKSLPTEQYRYI